MNANEQVNEVVDELNSYFLEDIADLLRQQQARIKELQESEQNLINHLNESDIEI